MQKLVPHLWFDSQAEQAAQFYTSIFKNAKIGDISRYSTAGQEIHGQKPGSVMTIEFEIEGYKFLGLNAGPLFTFTPAISFMVSCESIDEVNELWDKLAEDGNVLMPLDTYPFSERYGWIEDKFGLSWQLSATKEPYAEKITPAFTFTGNNYGKAEEAVHYYASVFKDTKIGTFNRYGEGQAPDKADAIMWVDFTLENQPFAAMESARANYELTPAISIMVNCDDQAEIDYYWKLSAVPEAEQCGWLQDKYGVSWQITPTVLPELLGDGTSESAQRVTDAYMKMHKFNIQELKDAAEDKTKV